MIDGAIYCIAGLALLASLFERQALLAASLVCISFIYNELIYIEELTWDAAWLWSTQAGVKDLLIYLILGFRRNTTEFILLLTFVVSCLFHQVILAQVLTNEASNLTLFSIRPEVMKFISVAQLTTVFYIIIDGGGWNGGKLQRVKHLILGVYAPINRVFHPQAVKGTK